VTLSFSRRSISLTQDFRH